MPELEQVRRELWKAVDGLSDEEINRKPAENVWSIAQVLEHLYLVERALASQMKHGLLEENEEPFPDKPIQRVLDRTVRMMVPNPALEPKTEPQSLADLKEKLERTRQNFLDVIATYDPETLARRALLHAGFGLLSLKQWIEFIALHEKRHIEQIKEIRHQAVGK
jgi:uncharacterized damage-inducible protein DinB